jgi:hypothetical protein
MTAESQEIHRFLQAVGVQALLGGRGGVVSCLKASLERIELSTVCLEDMPLVFTRFRHETDGGSGTTVPEKIGKAVGVPFLFVIFLLIYIITIWMNP